MGGTKLAIFDCNGTMVDSQANICAAMAAAFAREGLLPPHHHLTRRIVGLSLTEAMQVLLPDGDPAVHQRLVDNYKSAFTSLRADGQVHEPLYEGLVQVFDQLRGAGWQLAVATGKSDRGLALCLEYHGLAERFASLQTADRHPSKPHPAMVRQAIADTGVKLRDTAVIGDTSYDMAMAVNAGVRAIGVDWGYHDAQELREAGASDIAFAMSDLFALLEPKP